MPTLGPNENGENTGEFRPRITGTLSLIPNFNGLHGDATKVETFITAIEGVAKLDGWSQQQQCAIARLRLMPPARDFLESDPALLTTETWNDIKTALLSRFQIHEPRDTTYKQLVECTQLPHEDVRAYAARLQITGNKTLPPSGDAAEMAVRRKLLQEQLLGQFCKGIKDSIRRFVVTHAPKSLDDAVEIAKREELYATQHTSVPVMSTHTDTLDTRPSRPRERDDTYSGASRPESHGRNQTFTRSPARWQSRDWSARDLSPVGFDQCRYCKGPNHHYYDCRLRKRDMERQSKEKDVSFATRF